MFRQAFVSLCIAAVIALAAMSILWQVPTGFWSTMQPATCIRAGCFCEAANADSPIKQTANTISSLAFVFSGTIVMIKRRDTSRLPYLYSTIIGISSLIIGVGSAFYHASLTFIGQFFDVFGMFLLAVFLHVYVFERIWNLRFTTTLSLYLLFNVTLSWIQIAIPETRRYAFAIVLIIALLFERYYRMKSHPQIEVKWLRYGIIILAVAYIIWIADNTRMICFEHSLIQGHAIWHILGAISVLFLHRYYVSEKI